MQVQAGYHGLATVQYVPCRCGWPLHLDRNLRRGLAARGAAPSAAARFWVVVVVVVVR